MRIWGTRRRGEGSVWKQNIKREEESGMDGENINLKKEILLEEDKKEDNEVGCSVIFIYYYKNNHI
jgi:hypothetical protein